MARGTKLAILVGGGPAPGINSMIGAAAISAALEGIEVLGVPQGLAARAATAGLTVAAFRDQFEYPMTAEAPSLVL